MTNSILNIPLGYTAIEIQHDFEGNKVANGVFNKIGSFQVVCAARCVNVASGTVSSKIGTKPD